MDEKRQQKEEKEIDLIPLLKALASRIWLMLLIGVLFAGIAFGATKVLIKPTYRCGFTAYVNNDSGSDKLTQQDINAGKQLVNTYVNIIRSNTILDAAAESAHLNYSYSQLKGMVSASVQGDTEIINVYVEHQDPQTAYILANAIAQTAPTYMSQIVEGSSMKVIDYPMYSDKRYKPDYIKYAMLGFLVGAVLVAVISIIQYLTDDTVKSDAELEPRFSYPILGIIPDVRSAGNSKNGNYYYRYGSDADYAKSPKEG
ncbi:YveK family protein [Ruminococcus sp.]|uniref:YveK family protein n=1 Tax=Ruminococcus sp. TaxID=41978 RepID=UPI00388F83D3